MSKIKITLTYIAVAFLMSACYVSKSLEREVRIRINTQVPISVFSEGNSTFNEYMNEAQYRETFLAGVNSEFSGTVNIVIDDLNPEFEVSFDQLTVTESTKNDTIKNTDSPDNGKVFELTMLSFEAKGSVKNLSSGSVSSWSASKSKSESTTSLRSAEQIANGTNKEKNQYREKAFISTTANTLTQKVGRRSGVVAIKEIYRATK